MNVTNIINIVKSADKIALMAHVSPDGDAIGSLLGYSIALRSMGKSVDVYLHDRVPFVYSFLPTSEKILNSWNGSEYDAAIALDSGDLERLGNCKEIFNKAKTRINIDHHITNTNFGDYNHIEPHASSTGEVIYRIIKMTGLDLNKEIAECLFVAIVTDTGGFRYSNTSSTTMQVTADLINYNIDVSDISIKVFDLTSLTKTKLIGIAIDSLEIYSDGKIAVMTISKEQIEHLKANYDEFDGIINIGRSIIGVEAAALLVEKQPKQIRVNLRSNSYLDVAQIAKNHGGGGHQKAAGCTIEGITLNDAKSLILKVMGEAVTHP